MWILLQKQKLYLRYNSIQILPFLSHITPTPSPSDYTMRFSSYFHESIKLNNDFLSHDSYFSFIVFPVVMIFAKQMERLPSAGPMSSRPSKNWSLILAIKWNPSSTSTNSTRKRIQRSGKERRILLPPAITTTAQRRTRTATKPSMRAATKIKRTKTRRWKKKIRKGEEGIIVFLLLRLYLTISLFLSL